MEKELFVIQPGMILVEGDHHIITVHKVTDNYIIEYFEDGYFHETKFPYITAYIDEQNTTGDITNHIKYFY